MEKNIKFRPKMTLTNAFCHKLLSALVFEPRIFFYAQVGHGDKQKMQKIHMLMWCGLQSSKVHGLFYYLERELGFSVQVYVTCATM